MCRPTHDLNTTDGQLTWYKFCKRILGAFRRAQGLLDFYDPQDGSKLRVLCWLWSEDPQSASILLVGD